MSDILFIYEREVSTVSCTKDTFRYLNQSGLFHSSFRRLMKVTSDDINHCDVVVFIRPEGIYPFILGNKIKASNRVLLTLCDDDLLNRSPGIPWRIFGLRKLLSISDVLWSSSKYICDKYKIYVGSGRTAVTDTIVWPNQIYGRNRKKTADECKRFSIVYAAAPSHSFFFEEYINPIMGRLADRYPDKLSFTFVGVRPGIPKSVHNIMFHYVDGMPLIEYREFMKNNDFDIGIAPLEENEFAKCKYINKYIEYGMVGIAGIYSDVIPYSNKVVDEENGYLAKNTEDGWFHAFCRAIDNDELRRNCILNVQNDLRTNHSEKKIVDKLIQDIPELVETDGSVTDVNISFFSRVIYYLMRPLDHLYLGMYYIKISGLKGFWHKLVFHIKKMC